MLKNFTKTRKKIDRDKFLFYHVVYCSGCYYFEDEVVVSYPSSSNTYKLIMEEECSSSENKGYDYYGYRDAFFQKPEEINKDNRCEFYVAISSMPAKRTSSSGE